MLTQRVYKASFKVRTISKPSIKRSLRCGWLDFETTNAFGFFKVIHELVKSRLFCSSVSGCFEPNNISLNFSEILSGIKILYIH